MTKEEAIQYLVRRRTYSNYGSTFSEALDRAIESLSAQTEWIPVSERLPKVGQDVLFCDGEWTEEGYLIENGDWFQFRWSAVRHKEEVTAWMPLPKPYGESEEEK